MTGLLYFPLLILLLYILRKRQIFRSQPDTRFSFSIIVPFRNEARNLPRLIEGINKLDYPREKFEVIFVNDGSTDNSMEIINASSKNFSFHILHAHPGDGSPKKRALETGIRHARFDKIITWDADVRSVSGYLHTLSAYLKVKENIFLAGPVLIENHTISTPLTALQKGEFLALMALTEAGFTAGKPFLANGANLTVDKKAFNHVGGYAENMHYAGGDDIFLLEKIRNAYTGQADFIKSPGAVVYTLPVNGIWAWKEQRLRWSIKIFKNQRFSGFGFLILQFAIYTEILYRLWYFSVPWNPALFLFLIAGTGYLHYRLLFITASAYRYPWKFKEFLQAQILLVLLYPWLGMNILIHLLFPSKTFEWKERRHHQ